MTAVGTNGSRTFQVDVGDAVSKYQLVTVTATTGSITEAGATDDVIGIAENDIAAAAADRTRGDVVSVLPITHSGTVRVIAASAFAVGADLFKAAAGEVDDTGTETISLVALQAATAQGDVIEAMPFK